MKWFQLSRETAHFLREPLLAAAGVATIGVGVCALGLPVAEACLILLTGFALVLTVSFAEANAARAEVDRSWLARQRQDDERARVREEKGFE